MIIKKAVKFWCVALSVAMVAVFGVPGDASAGKTTTDGKYYFSDLIGEDDASEDTTVDWFYCSNTGIAGIAMVADRWEAIDRITVRCGGNESWAYKWIGTDNKGGSSDRMQHVNCSPESSDDGHRVTGLKAHTVGVAGGSGIMAIEVHCSNGEVKTIGNTLPDEYGPAQQDDCPTDIGAMEYLELYWGDQFGIGNEGGIRGLTFQCSAWEASPR